MNRACVALLLGAALVVPARAASGALAPAAAFAYAASAPVGLTVLRRAHRDGLTIDEIAFASPNGGTIHGELISPTGKRSHGGVLFVHWLGDPKTTNRSEFVRDALTLARRGSVTLSIDAMWAQKDWYDKGRTPETDYENSVKQVIDLRRSLDVLLSQPGIDPTRIAYVGHDFGAMYGAVLSGVDQRVRWYVLMAGNPSFAKWYTYGAKPKDAAAFAAQMARIDPAGFLAQSQAKEFFFQFADDDFYISSAEAQAFANAAPLPHGTFIYRAKHSLDVPEAFRDRIEWLDRRLNPASLSSSRQVLRYTKPVLAPEVFFLSGTASKEILSQYHAWLGRQKDPRPPGAPVPEITIELEESGVEATLSVTFPNAQVVSKQIYRGGAELGRMVAEGNLELTYGRKTLSGNRAITLISLLEYIDAHPGDSEMQTAHRQGLFVFEILDRGTTVLVNVSYARSQPPSPTALDDCGPGRSFVYIPRNGQIAEVKSVC